MAMRQNLMHFVVRLCGLVTMLIDYDRYRDLMFGRRQKAMELVIDAELWPLDSHELEAWLKGREFYLLHDVSKGFTTERWGPFRARVALELLQACKILQGEAQSERQPSGLAHFPGGADLASHIRPRTCAGGFVLHTSVLFAGNFSLDPLSIAPYWERNAAPSCA